MDTPLDDIRIGRVSHEWAQVQKLKTFHFPVVDSTNTKAKAEAFMADTLSEHLIVYFAEAQSSGRGRGTHTWSNANPGSQLLSTWSFINFNLKAPNDLYINDKKVGGLLIETVSQ